MNIKKIIKYSLIVLLPLLLLAKCSTKGIINTFPPGINSHPTQKVKVYGNFPYKDKVDFGLIATYIATNSICDRVSIGITSKGEKKIDLNPIWKEGNSFEVDVFHDFLDSGICGWELGAISYTMKGKPGGIVVSNEWSFNGRRMAARDTFACFSDNVFKFQEIYVECKKASGYCANLEPKKMQEECVRCRHIGDKTSRYIDRERFHATYSYDFIWCTAIPKSQKEIQLNFIDKGWDK